MRKAIGAGILAMVMGLGAGAALAQDTPPSIATQNVTLEVTKIAKLTVAAGPVALVIDEANAGVDGLEVVTATSTYNRVNNYTPAKITAGIDVALATGFTLEVEFEDGAGFVNISEAGAVDAVTGLARGATSGGVLTYRFSATPEAGELAEVSREITFTLTE